jgi:RNA-binding protein PNO1
MAHKSHRHKALQSQLEARPEISLLPTQPKAGPSTSTSTSKIAKDSNNDTSMEVDEDDDDDSLLISTSLPSVSAPVIGAAPIQDAQPSSSGFNPLPASSTSSVLKNEFRRVPIPPHRMAPLKREWVNLYTPMVEMLGLQVRMNVKRRAVEIKVNQGILMLRYEL